MRIVWWPADAAAAAEIAGESVDVVSALPGDAAVAILETRALPLAELGEARARFAGACVVRCAAEEAEAVLALLRDGDDLSLEGEPEAVLLHRARAALRRRFPDRDGLTGLRTRRAFLAELERRAAAASVEQPLSVLVFDIDHFKRHNDELGHAGGDAILAELARRLEAAAASEVALLSRIGGEELAALVGGGGDRALALAESLLATIRERPLAGARVTASAGVATAAAPDRAAELVRQADEALYAAKARGRDRAVSFAELRREALASGRDVAVEGFENRTRVMAEKVADVISRRGRQLFDELREQADVDALTGLYSRRYLDRRLGLEAEESGARAEPLALALLDLDGFGLVNKVHGWPSGDRVLADVAARVRKNIRGGDWVARYGGEEICVVMAGANREQAAAVLERIRAAVAAQPFTTTSGHRLAVTVSAGVAARDPDGDESVADLLERASAQLQAAKAAGKNRVCA